MSSDRRAPEAERPAARVALAVMARAPSAEGKTRLVRELGSRLWEQGSRPAMTGRPAPVPERPAPVTERPAPSAESPIVALRRALLLDTLDISLQVRGASPVVVFTPSGATEEFAALAPSPVLLLEQRGRDIGERMRRGFEDLFDRGFGCVVMIGSDSPTLPPQRVERAIALLRERHDRVVLGPAPDGGYYLMGLNAPQPPLFDHVSWSTPGVLARTLEIARQIALDVALLPEWRDVDTLDDLRAVCREAESRSGQHTRSWAVAHGVLP